MDYLFIALIQLFMPGITETFNPALQSYCDQLTKEFALIPEDRKDNLEDLIIYVQGKVDRQEPIKLNFICTHNSRRSQFGQVWAKLAGIYFKIPQVQTYSGGTEVTACNPRTIAALQRVGIQIETDQDQNSHTSNPRYRVHLPGNEPPLILFSKVYDHPANPQNLFCAIPVCSAADAACPVVIGAEERIYHGYDDPKKDDGTSQEVQSYDEACRLIARDLFYVFSRIKR